MLAEAGAAIRGVAPGAGTALGAVAAVAVTAATTYGHPELVDEIDDPFVDTTGEAGDRVGDSAADALDEIGPWS